MKAVTRNIFHINITDYYQYIRNIIRSFYFDDSTCKDLTQDVMIKLFCTTGTFTGEAQFKSWIYLVTRNHCINYKKKSSCKRITLLENMEDYYYTPDQDQFSLEDRKTILEIILQLPHSLSTPLIFFYYRSFKYSEIAKKMKIPIGTVKSRINAAKRKLRSKLRDFY